MRLHRTSLLMMAAVTSFMTVAPQFAEAAVTRTTSHVNMRHGPGANYRRITTIPPGTNVHVHGCPSNWCLVTWRRNKGWVNARYLVTLSTTAVSPVKKFGQ